MIVGHGDIARVLKDREDRLYFASGVSNSQETRESEYQREFDLLFEQDMTKHIVYFSSIAVFYSDTRYLRHKRQMEEIIKSNFPHYTIVRIGNITWGNNPHTFINYLKNHPEAEIKDEFRYIVEKEEFLYWIDMIPDWNCEITIPGQKLKIKEAIEKYGK